MIRLLARCWIRDRDNLTSPAVRKAYGVLCGAVGITLNLLLFAGKFFAGTISGSIAITADAFNNLSDAGSSVVTLLGFQLAGQEADAGHPFGHGRIEYLSGLIVSALILVMGFELGKTSVEKIIHPVAVEFSALTMGILVVSICVKVYMFLYNRGIGRKINSAAMAATALDSLGDSVATTAVLIASVIGYYTHAQIDGWVGVLVAIFILKSGFDAAKETVSPLLGQPPSTEFVEEIYRLVLAHSTVVGIHDLVVHDYGPGRVMISLHAEVPANEDILSLHDEIDNIETELSRQLKCEAVIHMDPIVTDDGVTLETRQRVQMLVHAIDEQITIHDFRMVAGPSHTNVIFDAVVPYDFRLTDKEVAIKIREAVRALNGNYFAVVKVEKSYI